jgi:hypothetical protein
MPVYVHSHTRGLREFQLGTPGDPEELQTTPQRSGGLVCKKPDPSVAARTPLSKKIFAATFFKQLHLYTRRRWGARVEGWCQLIPTQVPLFFF